MVRGNPSCTRYCILSRKKVLSNQFDHGAPAAYRSRSYLTVWSETRPPGEERHLSLYQYCFDSYIISRKSKSPEEIAMIFRDPKWLTIFLARGTFLNQVLHYQSLNVDELISIFYKFGFQIFLCWLGRDCFAERDRVKSNILFAPCHLSAALLFLAWTDPRRFVFLERET
jgi:hypothetical protein